ncbi:MAG: SDR family NAD(P)-dependent oxidoreductase [Wujia sp.]
MKSIIITGASRGIGRQTALALADTFEYMAICCQNRTDYLTATIQEVEAHGCHCRTFIGDISDYSFVSHMTEAVYTDTGKIDVLINNAAISSVGLFTDMTPEEWQNIINVDLTSIYNTCHCVVPHMVHEHAGRILNISSVWGLTGASCEVAYSAAKGAVNSFTKALAKELAPSHIAVNAVAFGAIDTSMNAHLSPEERQVLEDEIPYGRMATPEEAAICIKNIINMPSYLTGEIIKFDGGWI